MGVEQKPEKTNQSVRTDSPDGKLKLQRLFANRFSKRPATPPAEVNQSKNPRNGDEKFVPTCAICGEKHWPFHPDVPCINYKKAKQRERQARAKEKAKIRTEKNTQAKIDAERIRPVNPGF